MLKTIYTPKAPAAIGPYSQAVVCGDMLFTSGQIPVNPDTEEAGTNYENAVKTTCFLADMGDFQVFNEIYAKYFVNKPARSCVAVKTLPKNVLCEVEVIAKL